MAKARILQVLAVFLIVLGSYIAYYVFSSDRPRIVLLSGIGPIIMGLAILIISRSKAIRGK
jgi:hypothetical protein